MPFKYCQEGIKKQIFGYLKEKFKILKQKAIPKEIRKMSFAPKRPTTFKISGNDFLYVFFKSTKFYLSVSSG